MVWSFAGVRSLYDDGSHDPEAVTRDYVLKLDVGSDRRAPLLSIFGGKITTYRKLGEAVLAELAPFFPQMKRPWTRGKPLPGGDLAHADIAAYIRDVARQPPGLPTAYIDTLGRRHGSRLPRVLGTAKTLADLGAHFGDTLYAAEVDYLVAHEWAKSAEDVPWRRTKCGLHMTPLQRDAAAAYLQQRHGRT